MKKIPMRTCVVTHEKLPKKELVRVVRTSDGVVVDLTGKVNGRGAYLKLDKDVFAKAKSSKVLDKHLEVHVPDHVFEELDKLLD
ncbi:MAG: YlxR family protein [Bacilli bacterium]|nr:YlxR family protein [Bacilli bacterium]